MGSCSSVHLPPELQGTWTLEQIRAHWAPHLHALPAAVMRPSQRDNHKIVGRVIEVVGHNGLFSPLPLADPTWTAGRMDNVESVALSIAHHRKGFENTPRSPSRFSCHYCSDTPV
jgi:hypothetical protein